MSKFSCFRIKYLEIYISKKKNLTPVAMTYESVCINTSIHYYLSSIHLCFDWITFESTAQGKSIHYSRDEKERNLDCVLDSSFSLPLWSVRSHLKFRLGTLDSNTAKICKVGPSVRPSFFNVCTSLNWISPHYDFEI